MYYIIPAGSLPPAAAAYEEPQRQPTAAPAPQYTLGVDAAGNHVLYLAPAADQAPPPLLAADGSILQSQLLSAQDAPLLFSAAPELEEPGSGPMAANIDAWGEPGFLSAPAAFPSEQRLGGSAAAPLSLAFESVPPHAKLQQQSLAPPPSATQDTAFLMQQLQQLQRRQQQQQQQQQRQQQQQAARQAQLLAQNQQQLKLMPQHDQQATVTGLGQAWGQPGLNSSTQVQRLLSSIAQNNNNRRANPLGKMPPGGARAGQLGQVNPMNPLSRPGPMSAPTKPPQVAGKPPHVPPLRGHPSWAGQAWNPRPVGGSTLGSTGTGVFLPNLQQESKAAPAQPPAPATSAALPSGPGEALAQPGPPSITSPINSNTSGSAWSTNLSSNPSVYVEDP